MRVASNEYRVPRGIASIAMVALVLLVANSAFAQSRRGQKPPGAANDRLFAEAFFERSLVEISRGQARQALRKNPQDVEALFVEMERDAWILIAAQLVLSPHTVHRHVANIRNKLGRGSRSAAVAEAARLGLL